MNKTSAVEIWGGMECTINRVNDAYFDQLSYSGHYQRGTADIDLVASLGVRMLRYPVLWERHQPEAGSVIDWHFTETMLLHIKTSGMEPIAGLVHHGSGPRRVNFYDGSFENGLAVYARQVAEKFPWLQYYTPVNEPLTTARFCGLYGHWYPHGRADYDFYKVLLSECKATVMAMEAIRTVNPDAKLVQTEDLGKCYSTPLLAYQRDFENHRRWLSYDLLCGRVDENHYMWSWMLQAGITAGELLYFQSHPCVPHIAGFNYYITSERFIDEDLSRYPEQYHGGNYRHRYADIETVKVHLDEPNGPEQLLTEAWEHLHLPMAITECHLHSTREDQIRWFHTMWQTANRVKEAGVDIRAITAWAVFGLYGWNCLVTKPGGDYEPGVFSLDSGCPRPTALARLLQQLCRQQVYYHPVLENEGWWQRENRQRYGTPAKVVSIKSRKAPAACRPLLVLGNDGILAPAVSRICVARNIHHLVLDPKDLERDGATLQDMVSRLKPWGLVSALDDDWMATSGAHGMHHTHTNNHGAAALAAICSEHQVQLLSYAVYPAPVGPQQITVTVSDAAQAANFDASHLALAEMQLLQQYPQALVIRTGDLFGPWDTENCISRLLGQLRNAQPLVLSADLFCSPAYVPDLVHASLDLLLDGESGVFELAGNEATSWAGLARRLAMMVGLDAGLVHERPHHRNGVPAATPAGPALHSQKSLHLPVLATALQRYLEAQDHLYGSGKIAV